MRVESLYFEQRTRSPRVAVLGYDGLPMMPEDPYAYVEVAMQEPLPPDFVPKPVYPEFMPPEDDDPEKEDDDDPEEDPSNYLNNRDDDEEEEASSKDDADDEEEDEGEDEKEKEEHQLRPTLLLALSTPPLTPFSPFSSPLPQIISPPSQIISPPLPISSPPLPASPTYPLGYKVAMIRLIADAPSTSHPLPSSTPPSLTPPLLPIRLPTSSPPLLLPSMSHRADVPEVTLPPRKRLCIALGPRFEVEESSSAPTTRPTRSFRADYGFVGTLDDEIRQDPEREVGYGITDTWDEMVEDMLGTLAMTDVAGLSQRMTDFIMTVRQDTDEIYGRVDDAHDDKLLMSGHLNMLRRDRCTHARTTRLMESE
nr:hypothetical protein [Tanacetum cinerariifolium]